VSVPCRRDPSAKEPGRVTCAPVEYFSPFKWDRIDNTVFGPLSRLLWVEAVGEAANANSLDEVAASSWFEDRIGAHPLTPEQLALGACTPDDQLPTDVADGAWIIDHGKDNGATPGFRVIVPGKGQYLLKPDEQSNPERASAASVIGAAVYHAAGFNTSCEQIVRVRRAQLTLTPGLVTIDNAGSSHPFDEAALDRVLASAAQVGSATRMQASKWLPGLPIGPFRYEGRRADDPNDVVAHEDRRELRGYGVFAAWLNHVDAKAINSLDTLVTENGRSYVRHHLIDFGSALGSGGVAPAEHWAGSQYLIQPGDIGRQLVGFGFSFPRWHTERFYEARSIGRLQADNTRFNPDLWKPRVPNQAFLHARKDDKFWAAQRLTALTTDLLRAAVHAGDFGDPASEEFLVRALVERRDAIARAYLTAVNPIVDPALDGNATLTFRNAAVDAGVAAAPESYRASWSTFDNTTGETTLIADTTSRNAQFNAPAGLPDAPGAFIEVKLSAAGGHLPSWTAPVHAYFRHLAGGWKLVGFERLPDGR